MRDFSETDPGPATVFNSASICLNFGFCEAPIITLVRSPTVIFPSLSLSNTTFSLYAALSLGSEELALTTITFLFLIGSDPFHLVSVKGKKFA